MPKRPKQGPGPGAVSITGRRKARQSSIVPIPVQKKNGDALESYEQTVERPGPDSTGTGIPDEASRRPDRPTPD